MKRIFWTILVIGAVAVMAICTYFLLCNNAQYQEARDEYDKVRDAVTDDDDETEQDSDEKDRQKEQSAEKKKDGNELPSIDFDELKAINADVVGWLYFPGQEGSWSEISYPVLHADDNETYLHRTIYGTYNFAGCLFTDAKIKDSFKEYNTIIYGHTMKDGSMFGQLKFVRASEVVNDPRFWIITEDEIQEYTIYCMREVSAYDSEAYMEYPEYCDEYAEFVRKEYSLSERSFEEPEITEDSRTVTLSTCVGTGESGERLVIRGILTGLEK